MGSHSRLEPATFQTRTEATLPTVFMASWLASAAIERLRPTGGESGCSALPDSGQLAKALNRPLLTEDGGTCGTRSGDEVAVDPADVAQLPLMSDGGHLQRNVVFHDPEAGERRQECGGVRTTEPKLAFDEGVGHRVAAFEECIQGGGWATSLQE